MCPTELSTFITLDKAGNEIPFADVIKKMVVIKPASAPKTTVSQ